MFNRENAFQECWTFDITKRVVFYKVYNQKAVENYTIKVWLSLSLSFFLVMI